MRGSRNDLRAFVSTLENMFGVKYESQVLSQEVYEQIINSAMERGPGLRPGPHPVTS